MAGQETGRHEQEQNMSEVQGQARISLTLGHQWQSVRIALPR
jgi:hypothetical protein